MPAFWRMLGQMEQVTAYQGGHTSGSACAISAWFLLLFLASCRGGVGTGSYGDYFWGAKEVLINLQDTGETPDSEVMSADWLNEYGNTKEGEGLHDNEDAAIGMDDTFASVDLENKAVSEDGEGEAGVDIWCENPAPCGGCETTCELSAGPDTENPFTPTVENSSGVAIDSNGYLVLDSTNIEFPFIWIANSGEGTVSKLDTRNGCEVARYNVCSDPSRTAVDLDGNGVITCRGDGKVAKVAVLEQDCIDRNGNGIVDTSRDADGNCQIDASEMVASDECVLWVAQPDGPPTTGCSSYGNGCARAAGVDKENNIWVGFWNSSRLRRLSSVDGSVLQTINVSHRPYGLAIDQRGIIWFVSRDPSPHSLVKVDPASGEVGSWPVPGNYAYGMAIDPWGKVWVATGESMGISRFDPVTNSWTNTWTWSDRGRTRGVAIKIIRNAPAGAVIGSTVYVAHHTWTCVIGRYISVIDAKTLNPEEPIDLGNAVFGPVGVAVDSYGYLWSVNQCTNNASKIDTETKQVVGTYPVGKSPYTYSDMTGYALKTITAPQGYYRQVFEGWKGQKTHWKFIYVDADLPGEGKTYVLVRFRVADKAQDLGTAEWFGPFGPFPPAVFPLDLSASGDIAGYYLEVEVSLYSADSALVPKVKKITVVASLM